MKVFLAADHRGFELKESIKEWLVAKDYRVIDLGANAYDPHDDYVDYAASLATQLEGNARAIVFCGSGHGMDMAANRYQHIRAIMGFEDAVVVQGREHEDANVLVLPSDWVSLEEATERVRLFLSTDVSQEERHARRRQKLHNLGGA